MGQDYNFPGYKLPINPAWAQGTSTQGFVTPRQDGLPQVFRIPPRRVLPIIFIPGIMGSNLRNTADRQQELHKKNNIAWRPDTLSVTAQQFNDTPAERQRRLDPEATELDIYEPAARTTGDPEETADQRHSEVRYSLGYGAFDRLDGPFLQNDSSSSSSPKSKEQKAKERGWGEIYFTSYAEILSVCEHNLNAAFSGGRLGLYLKKHLVNVDPSLWGAHGSPLLNPLDEQALRAAVNGCWFPVHAMGYNWLKGNAESGRTVAHRIETLIKRYQKDGFQCEKVVLLTHSMGGLVARAVIHPDIGKLNHRVLGIVHGVMPATGAGAAYKRIRCGFEGSSISAKILGHLGENVTPVLGNSQGGLELLPSQSYGNNWLQVQHAGVTLKSLPAHGDPYEEIYKQRHKWFGLLNEDWINPAGADGPGFETTCRLLDRAKKFHAAISDTYHDESYGHDGADPKRPAWHKVIWKIDDRARVTNVDMLSVVADSGKGKLTVTDPSLRSRAQTAASHLSVVMLDAADPGDQTVPLHSAEAQLNSKKFRGIFRQIGYEHQASYSDPSVIAATLYSLVRIAAKMTWPPR